MEPDTKNPRVTVIICHHNYEEYLGDAIQSALSQTYDNFRICVIDDSSKDPAWVEEIVNEVLFDNEEPEIVTVTNGNSFIGHNGNCLISVFNGPYGPSTARNIGIQEMWEDTDYFAILDADDEMLPNKLSTCIGLFQMFPNEVGVVYGDCMLKNTTTGVIQREYREPYDIMRLRQECIIHSGAVISKSAIDFAKDEYGYYDENMRTCEDYDLWMRISERFMIVHVPQALTTVKIQPRNSSDTVGKEIWEKNWKRVHNKAEKRYAQGYKT